jgi:hypothetical protein
MWVDPVTGVKRFATRAGSAAVHRDATGYVVETDESRTTLPPLPAGAVFDDEARTRYREFNEARRDAAGFMTIDGQFAHYLADVHSAAPVPREPLADECEVLVVGAGFAGCCCGTACAAPGSTSYASARRQATSAAPGTGTATRAWPELSKR